MSLPAGRKLALLIEAPLLLLMIITAMTEACPQVSRRLLRWAARRCFAAGPVRARFEEEWLADLDDVPGKLAKLAHALGVVMLTAGPLWARSRWQRSRLARWLERVTTRLRPTPAVINGGGGAVLARAGTAALALAATGLTAALAVQPVYRLIHAPDASSRASVASGAPVTWFVNAAAHASGLNSWGALLWWRPMGSGMVLGGTLEGIPTGTTVRLYGISEDGKHHVIATAIMAPDEHEMYTWYSVATTLTERDIKSFEVTAGTTRVVFPPPSTVGYWHPERIPPGCGTTPAVISCRGK